MFKDLAYIYIYIYIYKRDKHALASNIHNITNNNDITHDATNSTATINYKQESQRGFIRGRSSSLHIYIYIYI